MFLMKKQEILKSIKEDEYCEILNENEDYIYVWDSHSDKEIKVNFIENLTLNMFKEKFYISPYIPKEYKFNKNKLIKKVFELIDKNTFITLNKIYFVYDIKDLDSLYEYTNDEYAYELITVEDEILEEFDEKILGKIWNEKNICLINMKSIIQESLKEYEKNKDLGIYFNIYDMLNWAIWTTLIHECRHLLLDTNIFLPEKEYPDYLSSEDKVEEYCLDYYEKIVKNNIYLY